MLNKLAHGALLLALVFCSTSVAQEAAEKKSDLSVLFVGHDPENPRMPLADMDSGRTLELYKERTAAYEKFLGKRFANLKVVHGADYKVEMSDDVDVTIFECRPTAMSKSKRWKDPKSGEQKYRAATYLPEDFDRAAMTISENSPLIGEPLGLKLDWL